MTAIEQQVVATVERALARHLAGWPDARLCVALSGGVDSATLLHVCHRLRESRPALGLRAIHVQHGLQRAAAEWPAACATLCDSLAVPYEVEVLRVIAPPGASVEAVARDARYAALRARLEPGEALLTAHHEDDQLETVLLQLVRGAGLPGLAAMPECVRCGDGWLLRPLLTVTRAAIEEYAQAAGLPRIDDPTNAEEAFDRNLLRRQIAPLLRARWPAVGRTVARSARHAAVAQELLDELAAIDAEGAQDGGRLLAASVLRLPRARQANLLRWWFRRSGLGSPSEARLGAILDDLLPARVDAHPVVCWATGEVRRHRGRLYAMRPLAAAAPGPWPLTPGEALEIPGVGRIELQPVIGAGIRAGGETGPLVVSLPQGGERLRLPGASRDRSVARLLREAGTEPWLRSRVPLVYGGDRLLAVGNDWVAADAAAAPGQSGLCVAWVPAGAQQPT